MSVHMPTGPLYSAAKTFQHHLVQSASLAAATSRGDTPALIRGGASSSLSERNVSLWHDHISCTPGSLCLSTWRNVNVKTERVFASLGMKEQFIPQDVRFTFNYTSHLCFLWETWRLVEVSEPSECWRTATSTETWQVFFKLWQLNKMRTYWRTQNITKCFHIITEYCHVAICHVFISIVSRRRKVWQLSQFLHSRPHHSHVLLILFVSLICPCFQAISLLSKLLSSWLMQTHLQ